MKNNFNGATMEINEIRIIKMSKMCVKNSKKQNVEFYYYKDYINKNEESNLKLLCI